MPSMIATPTSPSQSWPAMADGAKYLLSMGRFHAEAVRMTLRYQVEMLNFLKNRREQDLKLLEDLLSPDHLNETFDLCCCFWQNAFLDYSDEAVRIAEIGSDAAAETAKQVREEQELLTKDIAGQTVM
ncbi:hypothetical protein GGE07_004435 [Sinorhizobium terangae]|uniref:Phasin domain-containing protein n=1 Tax=Sinorhizobium terangae TaxID=110322 RepID=A0A6N7L8N3_SINTE|nr:hypothetical protein [Sinorhizobium terangae]MBB4187766.1 hypothetical protein [Sinorhizobium terangae]MQX14227.1 hypothetical protein [Sinorhizobium terangae]